MIKHKWQKEFIEKVSLGQDLSMKDKNMKGGWWYTEIAPRKSTKTERGEEVHESEININLYKITEYDTGETLMAFDKSRKILVTEKGVKINEIQEAINKIKELFDPEEETIIKDGQTIEDYLKEKLKGFSKKMMKTTAFKQKELASTTDGTWGLTLGVAKKAKNEVAATEKEQRKSILSNIMKGLEE